MGEDPLYRGDWGRSLEESDLGCLWQKIVNMEGIWAAASSKVFCIPVPGLSPDRLK